MQHAAAILFVHRAQYFAISFTTWNEKVMLMNQ